MLVARYAVESQQPCVVQATLLASFRMTMYGPCKHHNCICDSELVNGA